MSDYGVITEQGYPVGQFGFQPISEETKKKLDEDDEVEDGIYLLKGYVRILSVFYVLCFIGIVALILYNFGIIRF